MSGVVVVLQLSCPREARNGILHAAFDDIALEQKMDRLQWHVLRLRHAEDGVDAHDDAASSKQQERSVGYATEHQGSDLCNYKVEQPLGHQGCCHDKRAHCVPRQCWFRTATTRRLTVIGRALRREHERDGAPTLTC